MAQRVLSTQGAVQAVQRMRALLNGNLQQQVRQLEQQMQVLADPNQWDGRLAADFRNNLWPQNRKALQGCITALEQLQTHSEGILRNIMQAGGD